MTISTRRRMRGFASLLGLFLFLAASSRAQIDAVPDDLGGADLSGPAFGALPLNLAPIPDLAGLAAEPQDESWSAPLTQAEASLPRFTSSPEAAQGPKLAQGDSSIRVIMDAKQFVAESLKVIAGAQKSLDVEMFILENQELVDALAARAKDIPVRVVLDPFPGWSPVRIIRKIRLIRELRRAGAQVVFYPVSELHGALFKIDHAKILIADGTKAVSGGTNWMADPGQNHDYNLVLKGEVVGALNRIFAQSWAISNGLPSPELAQPAMDPGDGIEALLTDADHEETLQALLYHIARAQRIRAEEYLLNEPRIINALIAAHKRGADIQILLDDSDLGGVNAKTVQTLLQAGVPARFFHDPDGRQRRLHAKAVVFDDDLVILGSTNWSRHALRVNHEVALMFRNAQVAARLESDFAADWDDRSREPKPAHGLRELLILVTAAVGRIVA
ncbi:MAG: phosphatidylserine/phosphatidylglycerophosphate/cardiolipin synthase family protein [Elusimicrobia bacterium]|nr:phosphatidylserine/phosphatidylglycerophosphate/cardiolipin synthase family protein [Elusimicrobiota bacterium]